MRMILIKDVPGLGRRHEVKEVSPGYARNFLIPRKLAEMAAPASLAQLSKSVSMEAAQERVQKELLHKNIESLAGKKLVAVEQANEEGHLYAGIHIKEIAGLIKKEHNVEIPERCIELEKPIKELGVFPLRVSDGERTAFVSLEVTRA
ncbi:50S ribosomal protein L9 [Candidatus Parcubacteria bacterium]|nr:50S ribosomal protein L9 [Candidatus Parcubacteria bacterium]